MHRRAERRRLQTLFLKNPEEALRLGYSGTRAKQVKGEIGEINEGQLMLKHEVEQAPLDKLGQTIEIDLSNC
jgi:hypothetical protein